MAKREFPKRRSLKSKCDTCATTCTSKLQLLEHVTGHKHKRCAAQKDPTCLPHLDKLQYFFDTHLKQDPLVGLEYVEEIQDVNGYKYRCLLCSFHGDQKSAYLHITGWEHIACYIDRHHPDLSVFSYMYHHNSQYVLALEEAAAEVCETYSRKKIIEIVPDDGDGQTSQNVEESSSNPKIKTAAAPDEKGDVHKKQVQDVERTDDGSQGELSGFKGNSDFLDYLQKFEIRSDEDARLIKQILQNCSRALWRFQQEEAQQSDTKGPSASANRTGASGVNSAPTSQPQTDLTELFFSSIKTMEESEVGEMLQQIAATNAAFRGIDVPNVMKYLQATGRLKTS